MASLFQGKDHALIYSKTRQTAPPSLINRVVEFLKEQYSGKLTQAVDVGCGSGQNTFPYADYFENVLGTDISEAQLDVAIARNQNPKISFKIHSSHEIPLEDESVQLITAAAAAHWFDLPKFFAEGQRVLCPGGVVALYCYHKFPTLSFDGVDNSNQLNVIIDKMFYETLRDSWDERGNAVLNDYKDICIPMRDLTREYGFTTKYTMTLQAVVIRMHTTSCFQTYRKMNGDVKTDEISAQFLNDLLAVLGDKCNGKTAEEIILQAEDQYFLVMARK